jgi:hypothetical protein
LALPVAARSGPFRFPKLNVGGFEPAIPLPDKSTIGRAFSESARALNSPFSKGCSAHDPPDRRSVPLSIGHADCANEVQQIA